MNTQSRRNDRLDEAWTSTACGRTRRACELSRARVTDEVQRRFPGGLLDRPAQLALRSVHHVQLELARKARAELRVDDELHAAERRRQRADDEKRGRGKDPAPRKPRPDSPRAAAKWSGTR